MASPPKIYAYHVPNELRQTPPRIYGLQIEGDKWVVYFQDRENKIVNLKCSITGDKQNDIESVRDLLQSNLSFRFDDAAVTFTCKGLTDVIGKLYDTKAANAIERIKKQDKKEYAKLDGEEGEKPTYAVKKYSGPEVNGLIEAVLINGEPFFVQTINGGTDVVFYEKFETANMMLRPPSKHEYPPDSALEFQSEDELRECISSAIEKETLYSLYRDVKKFYTREYFVDTEPRNTILLTLYTITSYFQDKFSTVPYIWLIGDNGSGKNSIIITYSWLGYRVLYATGANGANIREYLGTVEEGQGTIAEDELDNFDEDSDRRRLYTAGYASGSCVPKILEGNTKSREQRYYFPYCQKMCASENLPSIKIAKGMLDRTFPIKCVKGFPLKNAKWTKRHTRSAETLSLIAQMQAVRKRLFAFRLLHFEDIINDIERLSISGRALELTEPSILLFHKYMSGLDEKEVFENEILPTLSDFLKDRLGRRKDTLEGRLYPIMRMMLDEAEGKDEFDNDTIYLKVYDEMEGREITGKSDMFYVDDLGMTVTRSRIMKVLKEKFKATPTRMFVDGGNRRRAHRISSEALERIRSSYEDECEIRIIEDSSARVDRPDRVSGQIGGYFSYLYGPSDKPNDGQTVQNLDENTPNDVKNEDHEAIDTPENTVPFPLEPGLPGQAGQSYSIEESEGEGGGSK